MKRSLKKESAPVAMPAAVPLVGEPTPPQAEMDPFSALDSLIMQLNELLPQAPQTRANLVTALTPKIEHIAKTLLMHGYKKK